MPFLGSAIAYLGSAYFELMNFAAIGVILATHMCFLSLKDVTEEDSDGGWISIVPLIAFGIGHALFTTMNAPTVPKLVKNPAHLPRVFTYLKIAESLGITFFIYMAGVVR